MPTLPQLDPHLEIGDHLLGVLKHRFPNLSFRISKVVRKVINLRPIHLLRVFLLRDLGARFGGRHFCHRINLRVSSRG